MIDFDPSEAELAIAARARGIADEVLAPRAAELDRQGGFPRESLATLAAEGLLGINVARAHGGLEAGAVAYSLAVTELATACASTTVALCVSNMVAEVVACFATPAQREHHIPRLCDGRHVVGAFALSEAGAGSDPAGMRTRAHRSDRGWVIEGSKLWITSGSDAGLFVVWARTSDEPGARGVSAFLVPGDTAGLGRGKPEHKLGLIGSTTVALEFSGCELPADALLDETGRGFPIAMMALDGGRIGIASQALGIGLGATQAAAVWARETHGASVPQWIQHALADNATELDAARVLTLRAAALKRDGKPFSHQASMAKLFASEKAFAACNRALAVVGAEGHATGSVVERAFRDVRVTMIYEGTSEVQRLVIARDIARRYADGVRS
ncbi:MAG: acyl-CoA dehydrogenase family protein [Deltaproteobacteria bacterium]|nr:acyl-CoA dehydrogenase family protein [Nannocystaceae bacterium]